MRTARTLALGALAFTAACRAVVPEPPPPGPESSAAALAAIAAQERSIDTLRALFRATARRGGEERSSRGALVVARPDRLRLQLFSFGVMTVFDYTANGDRYRVRRPLEGETRTGRFTDSPGDDLLAWDLRPLFFRGDFSRARVGADDEVWKVVVEEPARTRILVVSKRDGTIVRETLVSGGAVALEARYSDHRAVGDAVLPFRIEVHDPVRFASIEIDVERYAVNEPVEESVFALGEAR